LLASDGGAPSCAVPDYALPDVPIHETTDESSYEYAYSARPAQYYGPMRWGVAWPALLEKFGKQSTE